MPPRHLILLVIAALTMVLVIAALLGPYVYASWPHPDTRRRQYRSMITIDMNSLWETSCIRVICMRFYLARVAVPITRRPGTCCPSSIPRPGF
jgi:hypothetical protein